MKKMFMTLLFINVTLTGCWDRIEIEDRAVVLAISVDVATEEEMKPESEVSHIEGTSKIPSGEWLHITAQIAVPGRIPLGPSGGGGGSGGSGEKSVWVLESVGHTMHDAMENLQQEVADRLFLGHLRVIIISEAYARKGTAAINDYLRRNPEVRRRAWLAVGQGKAADFMTTAPELERVPALYLLSMLDHAVDMGKYPDETIGRFWTKVSAGGIEGNLPYLKIMEEDNVQIAGLAYFKGERMLGVTKPLDIGSYMGLAGFKNGGYSGYVQLPDDDNMAMFRVTSRRTEVKTRMINGQPHLKVHVNLEGIIVEKTDERANPIDTEEDLNRLGQDLSVTVTKLYSELIQEMQGKQCDIFGFGEYFRAKYPRYWNRQVKDKEGWERAFQHLSVEAAADVNVRRVGQKAE